MKKSDLKAGDIVLMGSGEIGIILVKKALVIYSLEHIKSAECGGAIFTGGLDDNLKYDSIIKEFRNYDINAVLSCDYMNQYLYKFITGELTVDNIEWTWERYPKRKIMLEGEEFMVSSEQFKDITRIVLMK